MIRKNIKINDPCPEKWENMQDSQEGKFCKKCSKYIVDFAEKTDEQIQNVFDTANGKEICGRIPSISIPKIAAGIILITNFTFVQAQIENNFKAATEQKAVDVTRLSGRLIFKETKKIIPNTEVLLITKSKLIKTTTNENGYFLLKIPNDLIEDENVLYFNFDKLNEAKRKGNKVGDTISGYSYGNQAVIFKGNEKIENKEFQIGYGGFTIGAVVIVNDPQPDYYCFNGKSMSREKFLKLRKKNPHYPYFSFEGKEAKVVSKIDYLDTLHLLYSD
ncbi:hypothetical protein C1637_07930 [Chryseobacterium lactis]|uniref:Carboxypeptidase regulatory-like domain-containing protein n=1 Tax=Chryseobacterium lactis TaxID=1241981 RepID=A0A3G6RCV5_CHRLC|nr:hypothetical protein [Chryseobacterium lactis]AZA82530.1 hypothetical protein EG342_11765 [Chryseobacterium lactis]AZB02911.1 hypothetical protein EG341_02625 [Chryseobacterium lactis]PNW13794.1 hypothetical protein C1637_07930 [Chryseobacterium lactis]